MSAATPDTDVLNRQFDIDFAGGSLAELIEVGQRVLGRKVNIIVAPQAAEVEVPALRLRSVSFRDLIEAVAMLTNTSDDGVEFGAEEISQDGQSRAVADIMYGTRRRPGYRITTSLYRGLPSPLLSNAAI